MPETWAYCDPCGRWFYFTKPRDSASAAPACPACASPARVTRDGRPPHPAAAAPSPDVGEQHADA